MQKVLQRHGAMEFQLRALESANHFNILQPLLLFRYLVFSPQSLHENVND